MKRFLRTRGIKPCIFVLAAIISLGIIACDNNGTNNGEEELPVDNRLIKWQENFESHDVGTSLNELGENELGENLNWLGNIFAHDTWTFRVQQGPVAGNTGRFAELISENNREMERRFNIIEEQFNFEFDFLMRSTDTATANLQLVLRNVANNTAGQAGRPVHIQINGFGTGADRTFRVRVNGSTAEDHNIEGLAVDVWHTFRLVGCVPSRVFDLYVGNQSLMNLAIRDTPRTGVHEGTTILGDGLDSFLIITSNAPDPDNPNRVLFDNFLLYNLDE